MVKVVTFLAMTMGGYMFWKSMDKVHVWIALRQDEKEEKMAKIAEIKRFRDELLRQRAELLRQEALERDSLE